MLAKLHKKLGDFWWYSLMLFCACRAADVFNVFIGVWLVPKYIDTEELGAVLPLLSFAGFISMPANVFAMTFMKEITSLAVHGEYGKMKSLIRGVFIGTGVFLLLAIVASCFVFPIFLKHIRIENGSLGVLILSVAFCTAIAPVYSNALQALKRFKAIALINIIGAPFRFLTMMITIPFRALSGYFAGQIAQPILTIIASVFCLRQELSVHPESYWSKPVFRRFSLFFILLMLYNLSGGTLGLMEQTILRQRLPEIDSAAYYMATRFSEIAGFVGATFMTIMFPFTAEMAEQGRQTTSLIIKSSITTIAAHAIFAFVFIAIGKPILSLLPNGKLYAEYAWTIPWLIAISAISYIPGFHVNTEVSAGRFAFLKWWIPLHVALAVLIILVTSHGFFIEHLPDTLRDFLTTHTISSLESMLWWLTITTMIKAVFSILEIYKRQQQHL